MSFTETGSLADLIERLQRLPTVGRKTAQRLAFYLLKAPAGEAQELARGDPRSTPPDQAVRPMQSAH